YWEQEWPVLEQLTGYIKKELKTSFVCMIKTHISEGIQHHLKQKMDLFLMMDRIFHLPMIKGCRNCWQKMLISSMKRLKPRSEEHTSELQSRFDLVCRLLLEK